MKHCHNNATSTPEKQKLILIGASTGGVDALIEILSTFPESCPPTLVVQHTGNGFGMSLATLLNRQCAPVIVVAEEGMYIESGKVIIGAGIKFHLTIDKYNHLAIKLEDSIEVNGHKPAIDSLFTSATPVASNTVAAVLTGMGRDGAKGLAALRQAGAFTIAQDCETSVVAGMPRAAAEMGGAQQVLPLNKIGPVLLEASVISSELRLERRANYGR